MRAMFGHKGTEYKSQQEFVNKADEAAKKHYSDNVVKLAGRITKKGIELDTMTMTYGNIGVNLEIIITDGKKSVKAWTTLAWGEVQKPHYRYYVK